MSLDAVYAKQKTHGCACRALSSRECIRRRYPGFYVDPWDEDPNWDPYEDEERCECSCHDAEYDDEDEP